MGFGGEMHDGIGLVLGKDVAHGFGIAEVALLKLVARVAVDGGEGLEVTGVGELVEVDELMRGRLQQVVDEVGADKASSASNENFHSPITQTDREATGNPERLGLGSCGKPLAPGGGGP